MLYFEDKMHQIRFRMGSTPDPARGPYGTSSDILARFKGTYMYF